VADDDTATDDDSSPAPVEDGPTGWIGSPCETDGDCPYDGARCLLPDEGFRRGMCTLPCDLYCDDAPGHPVTFCMEGVAFLPDLPAAHSLGDGACVSRCDFDVFPDGGCRPDYACVVSPRANEPSTERYVCVPGRATELSACHLDLAERGVAFEPTLMADESPADHPGLLCSVEEPVFILSPMLGVDFSYFDGTPTPRVLASCDMAHALADTILDVLPLDATEILHIGTYNCRVIAGSDELSRHGYGDAIDLYGFSFSDGTTYTLVDDWEHDTDDPGTDGGQWLYDAAHRWHDDGLWNIILTPNYNAAHDNHFHVDLTPGSDYIGLCEERVLMMNPGND
jgi:hypothetical protein